jgi:ATP-binding cassette, subfamily B, bacterial
MEADRIMILEDGKIAQFGPHFELINKPGLYQTLYQIQTGLEAQTTQEVAHGLSA